MSHRIAIRGHWVRQAGVCFARKFGRPPARDPAETVWLGSDAASEDGTCYLNGHQLGRIAAGRAFDFDVTGKLDPRNEVAVEYDAEVEPGDLWVEIR